MIQHVPITKTVNGVEAVFCDLCGKPCDNWAKDESTKPAEYASSYHEYGTLYMRFGYGTSYDMMEVDLQLCGDCVLDIYKRRKLQPGETLMPEGYAE